MRELVAASLPRRWLAGLALILGVAATVAGQAGKGTTFDIDEASYRLTLSFMRGGEGYYEAAQDALALNGGRPASSVRALRPPTLFLAMRYVPQAAWPYVAAVAYAATILLCARLAEPRSLAGALVGAVWVFTSARFLYLHGETWALPLLLASALAFREGRDAPAAGLAAAAALVREPFAIAILVGIVVSRRRTPWIGAAAVVTAAAAIHTVMASRVLDPTGGQPGLGNDISVDWVLAMLSPGGTTAAWPIGVALLVCGSIAIARSWRADAAARLLGPVAAVLAVLAIGFGRTYWVLMYGPAVSAFAPLAFGSVPPHRDRDGTPHPSIGNDTS